jgi:hypothetical protein
MLDTGTPFRNIAIVFFKDLLVDVEDDLICSIAYGMHSLQNDNHERCTEEYDTLDKPSANHHARTDGFVLSEMPRY